MLKEKDQSQVKEKGKKVIKKFMTAVFPDNVTDTHTAKHLKEHHHHHHENKSNPLTNKSDLKKRSNSFSTPPKLEYNPYGIFKHHDIVNLGQAFDLGGKISEPEHRLTNPLSSPNEYLPPSMQQEHVYLEEKYELLDIEIGSGGSATIKKVLLKGDETRTKVFALKKFSLFNNESQKDYYQRVAHEFLVTKSINHPNCISCYDLLQLPVTLQNAWGMTMDYYEYDLFKLIKSHNWKNVELKEKMCIFKQVCFGLKFLHENDLVHLDIKTENIMVSKNGLMKITDYGCLEIGHTEHKNFDSPVSTLKKRLGTPPFQPPEVAKFGIADDNSREPYSPFLFDYWSLGMLLFVVVTGMAPFASCRETDPGFKKYSQEYVQMIEKVPLFLDNISAKLPHIGMFSDPHGNDPVFLYFFWRLCDPNPRTRMTIPRLFKMKEFQELEMCVDESLYEANFYCHAASKNMKFKIPYGDHNELTLQKEVKHSMWDDIPTVSRYDDDAHNDHSMVPKNNLADKTSRSSDRFHSSNAEIEERSKTCLCYELENINSSINMDNQSQNERLFANVLPLSHHEPSCMKNAMPNLQTKPHVFCESDYDINSSTKYMIVNFDNILAASNCDIAAHSHNSLYSYEKRRSHTISAMSSQNSSRNQFL